VEVRIGVTQTPREIELEFGEDADRDALVKTVEDGVPVAKVAYVEISGRDDERRVGFSSF
jgi:hypothetical protein